MSRCSPRLRAERVRIEWAKTHCSCKVIERTPASGYVLVHVLSGAIRAQACAGLIVDNEGCEPRVVPVQDRRSWGADLGTYREGQSWVLPAFAYNITGKNASTDKPARALVVLVTSDDGPRKFVATYKGLAAR